MQLRDPTGDTEPDFLSDNWEGLRNVMIEEGRTEDEAVEILKRGWKAQHEKNVAAWNEQLEQRRRNLEEERNEEEERRPSHPAEVGNEDDEAPEWLDRPTPSFLDAQPARHVLKKLEKKEFVELWHFTIQGCHDAALIDLQAPDDTFGIVHTDKGLMLQSFGASSVSSKVTRDEDLSWEQLTEGKTRLIGCMGSCGWSEHEVKDLAKFFLNLDINPIRSQQYGSQAIMRYQEKVRRNWTTSVRDGSPYSIARINDELLKEYQRQIGLEIMARNNVSPKCENFQNSNANLLPNITFDQPPCDTCQMLNCTHRSAPRTHTLHHAPHHAPHRPMHRTAPHRTTHRTAPHHTVPQITLE